MILNENQILKAIFTFRNSQEAKNAIKKLWVHPVSETDEFNLQLSTL